MSYYKEKRNLLRIEHNNHPVFLSRLQNIFIESFSIAIYAIEHVRKSPGCFTPGLDNVCFKNSKYFEDQYLLKNLPKKKRNNLRYRSLENLQIQRMKIITETLKKQFQIDAENYNIKLRSRLIPKVCVKTLRKNYQGDTVKRIWIPKDFKVGLRPIGILTVRERILQTIVLLSSNPIIEFTSDSLSFGFREKRSAVGCIAYLFNKLSTTRTLKRKQTTATRIGLKEYLDKKTLKNPKELILKQQTFLLSKPRPMRKRRYHSIF